MLKNWFCRSLSFCKKNPNISNSTKIIPDKSAARVNASIFFDNNDFDFDSCNLTKVIKFLQKLAETPNASKINMTFTKHIINDLIKAREEKLKREASIPRKLEDGWEPTIKMRLNDFDCNALCDLSSSVWVMPKKLYDILDLAPLEDCHLSIQILPWRNLWVG